MCSDFTKEVKIILNFSKIVLILEMFPAVRYVALPIVLCGGGGGATTEYG